MAEASVTDLVDALNAHTKALNAFVAAAGKGGTESSGRSSSRDKDDDKGETRTRSRSRASDKDDDKGGDRGGRSSGRSSSRESKGPTLDEVKKRFSAFLQDCDERDVPDRTKWVKDLAYDLDKAEKITAIDSKYYQEALDELDKEEDRLNGDRRGGRDSAV